MRNYLLSDIELGRGFKEVEGIKSEKLYISLELWSNGDVSKITDEQIIAEIREKLNEFNP